MARDIIIHQPLVGGEPQKGSPPHPVMITVFIDFLRPFYSLDGGSSFRVIALIQKHIDRVGAKAECFPRKAPGSRATRDVELDELALNFPGQSRSQGLVFPPAGPGG